MLQTTNNLQLYTQNYLIDNAKGSVMITHGLGEYADRYAHVAHALNDAGLNVYTFDLRGHGHSEGERAFANSMHEYREDAEAVFATIPQDLPIFVLGHSMGGLITLLFLMHQKRKVKGVVFSGAAFEPGEDITSFVIFITKILAKFFPRLQTTKLNPTSISRDPQTVAAYAADPLIYHGGIKTGLGLAFLKAFDEVKPRFGEFDYPVLIMHGEADKLTNIKGSKELYAKAASQDKTLKIWEGAYHEIFNETNRQEVIEMTTNWIKERL
jgi:alpha-beta hydrolase superfamily lysophospholipase